MMLLWGVSVNGGFTQQPWGFPTKNDRHLGCFGGTTILGNTHMYFPLHLQAEIVSLTLADSSGEL